MTATPAGTAPVAPVMAMGEVVSQVMNADGSVTTVTADGTTTTVGADGSTTVVAADGTTTTIAADGAMTTVGADGTPAQQAMPTTTTPVATAAPTTTTPGDPPPTATDTSWITTSGRITAASNEFGIQGDWYAFGDSVTTDQSGSPYREGKYCVSGEATGDSANWGAGMGLDFNNVGEKMPYEYEGKITGFRIKFTGQIPVPARLNFVTDLENDVAPFIEVEITGESAVYNIADAQVPFSWGVDNAGQRVEDGTLYSIQILAPGDTEAGPIDLCIEEFEPVFDPTAVGGGSAGGVYINSDGFVAADQNDFGLTGPWYVISDGTSTTQADVPFTDNKYCVAGTFSGAADDWGAGLAFDLNNPPGEERQAFAHAGSVAGFQIGLSGTTPGNTRIQFVASEDPEGNQPFLLAQLNSTEMYPLEWAQVPTSWDVSDAGAEIGADVYTLQVYIEGDEPGPFEVCVEEFAPLSAAELVYTAEPAAAGFNGVRTLDEATLAQEYEIWKRRHLQDCGDGTACVPRDEGDCISEGIGYGMLLAVGFDDQESFDKLWAYFNQHKNGNGVMDWQTNACGATTSSGSATDGELDAAMALIQAACRWGGNYEADARSLLTAITTSEVARNCSTGAVLKPGDNFGGCSETNPSYVAPAYYREFEKLTGDSVWTDLLNSGYTLLEGNQARKGGVFSDWSDETGGVSTGDHVDDYGPDASRVPWRLATDYVWNGEARATALLDTFTAYVENQGGVARTFTPNSNYRGAVALSALHQGEATAAQYTDAWLMTSVDDISYFPGTLRPIYMLLAANKFEKGCN